MERGGVPSVALDGSAAAGRCDIRRRPQEGSRHVGLVGIVIPSGHRGRGFGPALLDQAVRVTPDSRASHAELEVFASNTRAVQTRGKARFGREGPSAAPACLTGRRTTPSSWHDSSRRGGRGESGMRHAVYPARLPRTRRTGAAVGTGLLPGEHAGAPATEPRERPPRTADVRPARGLPRAGRFRQPTGADP